MATAILTKKKAPHKLMAEEAKNDDNTAVQMNEAKMQELNIFHGDTVILRGNKRKMCPAVVVKDDDLEPEKIRMNRCIRNNLRVKLGDIVAVKPKTDIVNLTKIHVLPFEDSIEGLEGDLAEVYLKPYFSNAYRPVMKDNYFIVRGNFRPVEFKVVACEPEDCGIVAPNTVLFTEGEPIVRDDEEKLDGVGYDDVGGCRKALALIREMIELPLRHPILFKTLGVRPPR